MGYNTQKKAQNSGVSEGVDILSTGEVGGTKVLTENGDGTSGWKEPTSGGGGGGEKLNSARFGTFGAVRMTAMVKKGNHLFGIEGTKIRRMTRFSQGADFIPNSGLSTVVDGHWHSLVSNVGALLSIFSTSDSDNYIYVVLANSVIYRVDITDKSETLINFTDDYGPKVAGQFQYAGTQIENEVIAITFATTTLSTIRTYELIGTTMTSKSNTQRFLQTSAGQVVVEDLTKLGIAVSSGGYIYYRGNGGANNGGTIVKMKYDGTTTEEIKHYQNRSQRYWTLGEQSPIFECDGYVYLLHMVHDSEDFIGTSLIVLDKIA